MSNSIDVSENTLLDHSPDVLEILLKDRTTGRNILWATEEYEYLGELFHAHEEITKELITGRRGFLIQPRALKDKEKQANRTKTNAEVFTPVWVCNVQNNLIDNQWFGREDVFNSEGNKEWKPVTDKIRFDATGKRTWRKYVDEKRLEMACGEAPYLVSRYDTITGKYIPIEDRVGIIDRKLRVVNENTDSEADWLKWAQRAIESSYGFEFQGDSLLLARENILVTFTDNLERQLGRQATDAEIKKIATVVSWNIWQMDGLTYTIPYSDVAADENRQISLFDLETGIEPAKAQYCKIKDWRAKEIIEFRSLVSKGDL